MKKFSILVASFVFIMSGLVSIVQAGGYGYSARMSSSPLYSASINSYSAYKMDGYNFRSHSTFHRSNYKRHFTLNRVYDKDKRSYRALRKRFKK